MKPKKLLISFLSIFIITILLAECGQASKTTTANGDTKKTLFIYCAAGLKTSMDEIGKKFEDKYGVKVECTYANSSELIGQMEVSHKGDICLLASDEDYDTANKKGLTVDKKDLVYHFPVIAVTKGNPAGIKTIQDLAKSGVKVILGDPQTSPLGKIGSNLFKKAGIEAKVNSNVVATVPTVNEIVTYLSMKKADASIIWEDNALNAAKNIDLIQIPKEQNLIKKVPIATLKSTTDKDLSAKFINYTASEEGKAIFVKYHLKPIE